MSGDGQQPSATSDTEHRTVTVPVALLRKVDRLIRCHAHGIWCGVHEDQPWPCPMARLKQYIPNDCGEVAEDKFSRVRCVLPYDHADEQHQAADGWRWSA